MSHSILARSRHVLSRATLTKRSFSLPTVSEVKRCLGEAFTVTENHRDILMNNLCKMFLGIGSVT